MTVGGRGLAEELLGMMEGGGRGSRGGAGGGGTGPGSVGVTLRISSMSTRISGGNMSGGAP